MFDKPLDLVVAGRADVNPTIARPGPGIPPGLRNPLQQDVIIRQENIQSYKEIEYNLSIYSADRNWEYDNGTGENRFNFSVNLFAGNSANGVNLMPKGANRFRNIVRIEFIKAIVPIEITDVVVRKLTSTYAPDYIQAMVMAQAIAITSVNAGNSVAPKPAANLAQLNLALTNDINELMGSPVTRYDTDFQKNVYGYPFITLNIEELDTNTYGTSPSMDNAFGILQYDSNWTDNTHSLGFTSLIPKHMKCQRIYSPTPLATLNKLTIRLQQPNGQLVNPSPDTLDISGIFLSDYESIQPYFQNRMDLSGTGYSDPTGEYIWLDCKKWFSRHQIVIGDRIQVKNLKSVNPTPAVLDLMKYIQSEDGIIVAGVAHSRPITAAEIAKASIPSSFASNNINYGYAESVTAGIRGTIAYSTLVDGWNDVGYSRFIILRGKFKDPTTGAMTVDPYGNAADNLHVSTAMLSGDTKIIPGKLINLSRQTQLIFRVITREYDSTSLVRPDNL
jgi:hypothetical protein